MAFAVAKNIPEFDKFYTIYTQECPLYREFTDLVPIIKKGIDYRLDMANLLLDTSLIRQQLMNHLEKWDPDTYHHPHIQKDMDTLDPAEKMFTERDERTINRLENRYEIIVLHIPTNPDCCREQSRDLRV